MSDRIPAEVFPPGEFLRDELEARNWTQTEFAEIIGRPVRVINEIISGKVQITPKTATEMSAALGTSAMFWLNLETAYQLSKVDPAPERIGREARLRARFPVKDLVKRGWIAGSENYDVLETQVLRFFGAANLNEEIRFSHAARRNNPSEDISMLQLSWLFRIRQLASAMTVRSFSAEDLRQALPKLEMLMTAPEEVRHVPRVLNECGVRLVIAEPVAGSKIEGVCFWIDENQSPVIGLSMKTDRIDNFWFNLRHEIEHILRGDGKDFPEIDEAPCDGVGASTDPAEIAANQAAAAFCVEEKKLESFIIRHDPVFSETALLGFARVVGRHPGIVAGQIHNKTKKYFLFKKHLARIRYVLIETALTDGYGKTCSIEI